MSDQGDDMRRQAIIATVALALAPFGAEAADLVVWRILSE